MPPPSRNPSDASAGAAFAAGLVLAAAASLQLGAALATTLFDDLGPAGTALLRLVFAALLLMALWRPRLGGEPVRAGLLVALFGVVVAGLNLSFHNAIDRAPLGVVMTIAFAGPLGVAVGSSRRIADGLWALLAAAGIVFLSRGDGGAPLETAGLLLALANAVFWAAYILVASRVGRAFAGGRGPALALVFAAAAALPAGLASAGDALLRPSCSPAPPRSPCSAAPFPTRARWRRFADCRRRRSGC